jgi:hypothetical protein
MTGVRKIDQEMIALRNMLWAACKRKLAAGKDMGEVGIVYTSLLLSLDHRKVVPEVKQEIATIIGKGFSDIK